MSFDKATAVAEMRRRGITRVEVTFSGGDDEGGADQVRLVSALGTVIMDAYDANDALVVNASQLPEDEYGSFTGEFHVSGTYVIDAAADKVTVTGRRSVSHDEDF